MSRSVNANGIVFVVATIAAFFRPATAGSLSDSQFDSVLNCGTSISCDLKPECSKSSRIRDELQSHAVNKTFFGSCLVSTGLACAAYGLSSFLTPSTSGLSANSAQRDRISKVGKASIGLVSIAFGCVQIDYGAKGFHAAGVDWSKWRAMGRSANPLPSVRADVLSDRRASLDANGNYLTRQ